MKLESSSNSLEVESVDKETSCGFTPAVIERVSSNDNPVPSDDSVESDGDSRIAKGPVNTDSKESFLLIRRVLTSSFSWGSFDCSLGVVSFSIDLEGEGIVSDETKSSISASVDWD